MDHQKVRYQKRKYSVWEILSFALLALGISIRIYQYVFHKDLWLDEAMLSFALYGIDFKDIFFQPLPYTQAAPLGFLLVSKLMCVVFGYGEWSLYFLPLLCGIGSLLLAYKMARLLFSDFGVAIFMLLVVGSLGLLYYSAEFKQYGIESFCVFLLLYLYVKGVSCKIWSVVSIITLLFSNTIIFIIIACYAGFAYAHKQALGAFIRQNTLYIIAVFTAFALYYVLYIRFQAVQNFYEYWEKYFLPHTLGAYKDFIWTLFGIYEGFTPFARGKVIPFYMFAGLIGFVALYKTRRDMFVIIASACVFYVLLSFLRIYPFGHEGVIGGRLSLFMAPLFYMLASYGIIYLLPPPQRDITDSAPLCKILSQTLKITLYLSIAIIASITFYRYIKIPLHHTHHNQQTHQFIFDLTRVDSALDSKHCIYVYKASEPALKYYLFLDSVDLRYKIFERDTQNLTKDILQNSQNCSYITILASHISADLTQEIEQFIISIDPQAEVKRAQSGGEVLYIKAKIPKISQKLSKSLGLPIPKNTSENKSKK
ncbi:hypothetical protein [uncultured Helicobacter sp.]|uniref:hypothetical protein n=1 Tax=uncultured Helicobacter sp. TaxID=175537 RepID=UPI00258E1D59|nr:hypothetical protein [uncultured Helicobacter sp.]